MTQTEYAMLVEIYNSMPWQNVLHPYLEKASEQAYIELGTTGKSTTDYDLARGRLQVLRKLLVDIPNQLLEHERTQNTPPEVDPLVGHPYHEEEEPHATPS